MGTDVELLLDAEPGDRARRRARPGRGRVRAARAGDVALPRRLGALGAQPRRPARRREPRSRPGRRAGARGPRGDRRPLRPDRPRRRSSRPATTARFDALPRTTLAYGDAVPGPRRRRSRGVVRRWRPSTARPSSSSPARTSTSAASARATLSTASPTHLATVGPCLVNAGGDLAVRGGAWPVGVTDELTLELTRGGMATSGRDRRRWHRGGEERHHLIDPSTGRPAVETPVRVTVVADSATAAEVAAKAVFLGGDGRPCRT